MEYDYINVGTGSPGCVLSNRRTEDDRHRVFIIEAGQK